MGNRTSSSSVAAAIIMVDHSTLTKRNRKLSWLRWWLILVLLNSQLPEQQQVQAFLVLTTTSQQQWKRRLMIRYPHGNYDTLPVRFGRKAVRNQHDDDEDRDNYPPPPRPTTAATLHHQPIRLNKVFKAQYSRRQADAIIATPGRVTINGQPVASSSGCFVTPFLDQVALDGKVIQNWEAMNGIFVDQPQDEGNAIRTPTTASTPFEYIKYWKPAGVTCTTDRRITDNILDALELVDGYTAPHRIFPVGRLDKATTGLILLTSDGRVPNAVLRQDRKRSKVYRVLVDKPISDSHFQQLQKGVVITTIAQRDRQAKPLTAPTLPCVVQRHPTDGRAVQMTLYEGRNRQIRKMMAALGYTVLRLHRVAFGGIALPPLQQPGDWARLSKEELQILWHPPRDPN